MNIVFAGHLGDPIYLQAASLGCLFSNITCLLPIYGLNSAIGALCSQANGSGNLHKVGIYLNKGRISIVIFFVPVFAIMFMCERILLLIGIDPNAAYLAQ
jgi:MATE family multidrug resistance protein